MVICIEVLRLETSKSSIMIYPFELANSVFWIDKSTSIDFKVASLLLEMKVLTG